MLECNIGHAFHARRHGDWVEGVVFSRPVDISAYKDYSYANSEKEDTHLRDFSGFILRFGMTLKTERSIMLHTHLDMRIFRASNPHE